MKSKISSASLSPTPYSQEFVDPWNRLTIDLDALKYNFKKIRSLLDRDAPLYAVLKADAYGHGLREIALALNEEGCQEFAVESPQEGVLLRNAGINGEILLMNPIPSWMAEQSVRYDLSVSVIHPSILPSLEAAAKELNKKCSVHLNLNIGLYRMGIAPSKVIKIAKSIHSLQHLELTGIFGQPRDPETAPIAMQTLQIAAQKLKESGICVARVHFANSINFLRHPESRKLGVRLGILLYGILPPEESNNEEKSLTLQPVMNLDSRIVQIQDVPPGSRVGYHSKVKIKKNTKVGVIPIGYYHGLDRKMVKNSYVLLNGKKAPFIGSISMNASMVDITDIPESKVGDQVIIFGNQEGKSISLNRLAKESETIAAELMMRFGNGIARKYELSGGRTVTIFKPEGKDEEVIIRYCRTIKELPKDLSFEDIVQFIEDNFKDTEETRENIAAALDYALASSCPGKGYILVAESKGNIMGALVCIHSDTHPFIPGNIIVYICVDTHFRGRGLGSRLIKEALECSDGPVKLHVEKSSPAVNFYRKLGFKDNYLEMRIK